MTPQRTEPARAAINVALKSIEGSDKFQGLPPQLIECIVFALRKSDTTLSEIQATDDAEANAPPPGHTCGVLGKCRPGDCPGGPQR